MLSHAAYFRQLGKLVDRITNMHCGRHACTLCTALYKAIPGLDDAESCFDNYYTATAKS